MSWSGKWARILAKRRGGCPGPEIRNKVSRELSTTAKRSPRRGNIVIKGQRISVDLGAAYCFIPSSTSWTHNMSQSGMKRAVDYCPVRNFKYHQITTTSSNPILNYRRPPSSPSTPNPKIPSITPSTQSLHIPDASVGTITTAAS